MPAYFSAEEDLKYVDFDFDRVFELIKSNSALKQFSYLNDWLQYWFNKLNQYDKGLKKHIQQHPDFHPLRYKMREDHLKFEVFQHQSIFGESNVFYFHIDVQKMIDYLQKNKLPIRELSREHFVLDPNTKLDSKKDSDSRIPFFLRMFGIQEMFIIADGNHRIKYQIHKGIQKFKGYIFDADIAHFFFFFPIEQLFYLFLKEAESISRALHEGINHKQIYKSLDFHRMKV